MARWYTRYTRQADADYLGHPHRVARCRDRYGESHVVVEMRHLDQVYWLDWIGAGLAPEPDEFDHPPFPDLSWQEVLS